MATRTAYARPLSILALALIALVPRAQAALDTPEQEALLTEATALFDQANELAATDPEGAGALYRKSILRYERLVQEGGIRNGKLYYDLANAHFLAGDVGRAILNYRRAQRLIPNDPNLRQNLGYVRNQRADRIEQLQKTRVLKTLFFWHYDLSARTRMVVFACAYIALWLAATARLFQRRPALTAVVVLCLLLSALTCGSAAVEAWTHSRDRSGVILADEVVARKGNGESYQPSFEEALHAGAEFALVEERGDWRHIELADGRRCWIPAATAELVGETEGSAGISPAQIAND